MARKKDRVKIENRSTNTSDLDVKALDEYLVGGMDCVRFKKRPGDSGFDPKQPSGKPPNKHYDCQLLLLTVPKGFRRIHFVEIADDKGNSTTPSDKFGDPLAEPASKFEPVLLHVIYDLDTTSKPGLTDQELHLPKVAQDHCARQGLEQPKSVGTRTPCAKSSAKSWTGSSTDGQALFVRYKWNEIYKNNNNTSDSHQDTHDEMTKIFNSKNDIAMAAMVAPDRTVIWVPFLEGNEVGAGQGSYRIEKWKDDHPYELGPVIYLDKPGIWVDPELRFRV
ncbi:hypothetical protein GGR26_000179 [Lewinella marina]|uniref:Uncharacterized protein n=1 Tax=Neolewinella marina TaxID=438751 RepID=A0A2G0CK71_9BACT|nr:hypothetical protein [Neolewinella marina]NJB84434.1 hypothetical protein [Neolewinella marina]PHL00373.1 hypothetical protein CGL56_04885 [Neolewinella marina]